MKNRWLIAASAVGIHISIGSVYAWSIFSKPMMEQFGWTLKEVSLTFSIAIYFLGLAAAFLGRFVESYGPRRSGIIAAFFFCSGLILSGIACKFGILWLLYVGYGVLGGIGIGIGYITPISTLIKWFPDRKGLATGIAIMGFGFASVIFRLIAPTILKTYGIPAVFYIFSGIYFVLILGSSLYIAPPVQLDLTGLNAAANESGPLSLTSGQAVRTLRFYYLWMIFFLNITCGIAIISVASPMAQDVAGMSTKAAATLVAVIGIFNGLGRFGWSSISDYIGRPALWLTFFAIQTITFFFLPGLKQPLALEIVLCLIITCYGGGFASMPAFISDIFGPKNVSAILGLILTAWSAAGIVGPIFIAWIRESTGSYEKTFLVFSGMLFVGFLLAFLLTSEIKRNRLRLS